MREPAIFETVVAEHRGRVYVPFPPNPDRLWGAKPCHRLGGTLNGMKFRGIVEFFGGELGLSLGPAWRRECGLGPGSAIKVRLAPEGPLREGLDADIAAALDAEPKAGEFFDGLAQFYRKAWLKWIDGTKRRPDERARRIAEMVAHLEAGRKAREA
jgi:hypothetical protein